MDDILNSIFSTFSIGKHGRPVGTFRKNQKTTVEKCGIVFGT
jgi:hypothetical protein